MKPRHRELGTVSKDTITEPLPQSEKPDEEMGKD
jgi:hypothetical protein